VVPSRISHAAKLEFGDGEEQQKHAQQLQEERERLLDSVAPRDRSGFARFHPEAERGDDLPAAVSIKQVEGDGECAHHSEQSRELDEG
jgi:hypothetical protein